MTVPGVGGRPAKPTALRILHGDRKDRIPDQEPIPVPTNGIQPPEDMSDQAKAEWFRLSEQLERAGVLTEWDIKAYRDYCEAVVSAEEAQHALDEEGEVVDMPIHDRNGNHVSNRPTINPWWKIRREASRGILDGAARFGLTPADRSRLIAHGKLKMGGKPGEEDKPNGEDLLSG